MATNDINGAYPSMKSRHARIKTFVDKSQIKEIFGQSPGKYHGFAEDYNNGGTYNPNPTNKMFVDDLNSYTRHKLRNKPAKFKLGASKSSQFSSFELANKSLAEIFDDNQNSSNSPMKMTNKSFRNDYLSNPKFVKSKTNFNPVNNHISKINNKNQNSGSINNINTQVEGSTRNNVVSAMPEIKNKIISGPSSNPHQFYPKNIQQAATK